MDLIDKDKLMSVLNDRWLAISPKGTDSDEAKAQRAAICRGIDCAVNIVADAPTVEAVPLEPLCRYLEVYARTPIYNMRHTAEWWREELEKEKWEKWTVEHDGTD